MVDEEKMKFPTEALGGKTPSFQAPSSVNAPAQAGISDLLTGDVAQAIMASDDPEEEMRLAADGGLASLMGVGGG